MKELTDEFYQIISGPKKIERLEQMLNDLVLAFDSNDIHAAKMYLLISEEIG